MVDIAVLRNANLNRLPVLWELLRCRNVSLAAANLNLTQSTVSAALKSLREFFDDELLVPSGRELVLTERAREMVPRLEATLDILGELIGEPDFDPAKANGVFRVSTADYVSALLVPDLCTTLQTQAPQLTVQMVPAREKAISELQMGLIDLIIGPEQVFDWIGAGGHQGSLTVEKCYVDPLIGIQRAGTGGAAMDVADYLNRPHASFHLHKELPASIEHDVLTAMQLKQNNRLLIPEFTLLPMVVAKSDMVSLIPLSMARHFSEKYDIEMFQPPVEFPPLVLCLLWVRGREKEVRFKWFLNAIRDTFRRLDIPQEGSWEVTFERSKGQF